LLQAPEDPRKAVSWPQNNEEIPVPLTMYTTTWCGFCKNLKRQLGRAGIEVTEVDIELDPAAAEFVMSVNGGNQTVPTLLFPDGSTMCNPSAAQVQKKLAQLASPTG
jgi:mycoredoxin